MISSYSKKKPLQRTNRFVDAARSGILCGHFTSHLFLTSVIKSNYALNLNHFNQSSLEVPFNTFVVNKAYSVIHFWNEKWLLKVFSMWGCVP